MTLQDGEELVLRQKTAGDLKQSIRQEGLIGVEEWFHRGWIGDLKIAHFGKRGERMPPNTALTHDVQDLDASYRERVCY